jgi:hypothetical protein
MFGYFFVQGWREKTSLPRFLSGLLLGLLVLIRLETIVLAAVIFVALLVMSEFRFLRDIVFGALGVVVVLLLYNFTQFGNSLHLGILRLQG